MTALIIVDMQNDFLPGGALAVDRGDEIIPIINQLLEKPFDLIIATKDWHPIDHVSFAVNHPGKSVGDCVRVNAIDQILWPVHCVQNSLGAEFGDSLKNKFFKKVFYKGTDPMIDSYSTFFDNKHLRSTGLSEYLKENAIHTVYLAGIATDYCVKYSALDALQLGFEVKVIEDACRGVNLEQGDSKKALDEIKQTGGSTIFSSEVFL